MSATQRPWVIVGGEKNSTSGIFFIPPGLVERALSGGGAAIQHLPAFEKAHKKGTANFFSRSRTLFFEART